jgi:tetratricopeptide (TPR) repeat protein
MKRFDALTVVVAATMAAILFAPQIGYSDEVMGAGHDVPDCNSAVPEKAIAGCTSIIMSGTYSSRDNYAAHVRRGWAYAALKRYDDAISDFTQALEFSVSNKGAAYRNRGLAYEGRGDLDRAIADYSAAIPQCKRSPVLLLDRALVYLREDRADLATADYKAAKALPGYCGMSEFWATRRVKYEDLISGLDAQIAQTPTNLYAYDIRCKERALAGRDLSMALADCNHVIDRTPGDYIAREARGIIFFRAESYANAIEDFDAAIAARADSPVSLYMRGLAKIRSGNKPGGYDDTVAARLMQSTVAADMAERNLFP